MKDFVGEAGRDVPFREDGLEDTGDTSRLVAVSLAIDT